MNELSLSNRDLRKCDFIVVCVILQCVVVFFGAYTIFSCYWDPLKASPYFDFDTLTRIMYLYDSEACGLPYISRSMKELILSNNTYGLKVIPIKHSPAVITKQTRLASKTRRNVELSVYLHGFWIFSAVFLKICVTYSSSRAKVVDFVLSLSFYLFIVVFCFDVSMAITYVAHIQQSLTKGMIIRYSGWSVELKVLQTDDFAGWLPITASICWLRGIVVFALNFYCCTILMKIRKRLRKREAKIRLDLQEQLPIPDSNFIVPQEKNVLFYRRGERQPYAT